MQQTNLKDLRAAHQNFIDKGLKLDLTRGKPSSKQLDLSNALLQSVSTTEISQFGTERTDLRNYGILSGLQQAQHWFSQILDLQSTQHHDLFVGGNSSLSLMQFSLWLAYFFGLKKGDQSWQAESNETGKKVKMLCPVPGYDRHFSLCEHVGIEMINVPLTGSGPDMEQVEQLVKSDPMIKGIWCVPRFSNPTGEVYDVESVKRIASLATLAGKNFYVFWDNAYAVHALDTNASKLPSIARYAESANTQDSILQFASTSKITYAGAGMSAIASSATNIAGFVKHFGFSSIGPDKVNQYRHIKLLPDLAAVEAHMQEHAALIKPKFELVDTFLKTHLTPGEHGNWNCPAGGYFISFDTQPGLAERVIGLAREAGVKLTPAGSTFPYKKDPQDSNIRLAPTYPSIDELKQAMEVFVNCVKLATSEATATETA